MQALSRYWQVCPQLRAPVQAPRPGYLDLAVAPAAIKPTIHQHPEFQAFTSRHERALRRLARPAVERLKALARAPTPRR
jgi:type I restriction enzyme M protein